MDPFKFMKKLFISAYAVEVCKLIHEIDIKNCCGCRQSFGKMDCLMLTEDEKIELNFDRALKNVNVEKICDRVLSLMQPFQLTLEIEAELYSWTERNPAKGELYNNIKDTVKVIRMY